MAVRGHPEKTQQAMEDEKRSAQDVKEVFTSAGGSEEEWGILFQREDVPSWALQRIDEGEPSECFTLVTEEILADGDLLLYQVVDDEGETHDTALARVLEVKRSKSHVSLVIKFLAAKADDYRSWAEETFNERRDFHLHLCRGKVKDCKGKPTSKTLRWVHTDGWRLTSYHSVCSLSWCLEAAMDDLRHMVNRWIDYNSERLNDRWVNGGTEVLPSFWELLPARQDNRKAVPAMSSRPHAELKGSKPHWR